MDLLFKSAPVLAEALTQTLLLSVLTCVFAGLAGFIVGEASVHAGRVPSWIIRRYIDVVRGIPLLVFIFLTYYSLPAIGIDTSATVSAVISLTLYFSGFVAESVRGAIQSIPKGQIQSALALGMTRTKAELNVVLPQAARVALPSFINLLSIVVKSTALVSIIGVWELTLATREIVVRTARPFELFLTAMIIYFIISYSIVLLSKAVEARLAKSQVR